MKINIRLAGPLNSSGQWPVQSWFSKSLVEIACWNVAFMDIRNHELLQNVSLHILISGFIFQFEFNLMVPKIQKSEISSNDFPSKAMLFLAENQDCTGHWPEEFNGQKVFQKFPSEKKFCHSSGTRRFIS